MKLIRSIIISFSLYSRLPMPRIKWKDDDMAMSLDFFPLVGAVIGGLIILLNTGFIKEAVNPYVRAILSVFIPVAVTGGFHLDGFMDTSDALNSYGDKEKKLLILKDPHIGAFAVISLLKLILSGLAASLYILSSDMITDKTVIACGFIFIISRCLSGITSIRFKKAKSSGMLTAETGKTQKITMLLLLIQLIISISCMLFFDMMTGICILIISALFTLYYRYKTYKEFGGVTGDTAGYYLSMLETLSICSAAVLLLIRSLI